MIRVNEKMIKALIIEDDLQFSKKIINSVISKFNNIQLSYIATTYKESIDILLNNRIDLIFLDLNVSDGRGINILKELNYMNTIKKPQIIIISEDIKLTRLEYKNNYICETINKLETFESILDKIEKVINNFNCATNCSQIEALVTSEIIKLGYNIKYKGTFYIIEAIMYVYNRNNFDFVDNLEQNVYRYISYKHKKSINNIKTNIIKATNEREKEKMLLYKLTPKSSIITVLNKVRNQYL